jgi:hypothetical protein
MFTGPHLHFYVLTIWAHLVQFRLTDREISMSETKDVHDFVYTAQLSDVACIEKSLVDSISLLLILAEAVRVNLHNFSAHLKKSSFISNSILLVLQLKNLF